MHGCTNLVTGDPYPQAFFFEYTKAVVNYFLFLKKHGASLSFDFDMN